MAKLSAASCPLLSREMEIPDRDTEDRHHALRDDWGMVAGKDACHSDSDTGAEDAHRVEDDHTADLDSYRVDDEDALAALLQGSLNSDSLVVDCHTEGSVHDSSQVRAWGDGFLAC